MTSDLRRLSLLVLVVLAVFLRAMPARAQSADEVKAARELFEEAFKDEQEKRYPEALEKFRRVAKVKESAAVRYRIATVLAAMGYLREARDLFRALAASRSSLPTNQQDIADSAAERAAELDKRIPRLAIRLQDEPPRDPRVSVNGTPVPVSTTARSIELDPGDHVVAAAAPGMVPSEKTVTLADGGGETTHTVTFTPEAPVAPPPPPPPKRTLGWVALGAGAALVATGALLLVAREGAIDDIKDRCPGNVCPIVTKNDVQSDQDQATVFGPLGVGIGVVGLVAIGVGTYLLLRPPHGGASAWNRGFRLEF
jgi:tetratricopeptide (TPR) repeat protein